MNIARLLSLLLVAVWGCQPGEPAAEARRPNIILIIGDDQGYRDFGFMGSEIAITPHLDALAESGALFPSGYATASVCQPSLRTLLTGLEPLEFATRARQLPGDGANIRRFATLPRVLGAHGYTSFQSGKYWEGTYEAAGFDEGMLDSPASVERSNGILREGLEPVLEFVDRNRDGPFFVWFAPKLPHIPHDPPPGFLRPYLRSDMPLDVASYFGCISWLDDGIGQLLDHLERLGIRDDTLVVFLSDNGWEETATDASADGNVAMFGGPSGKMSLYETGFRTPVIFHWPGRIGAGRVIDQLISLADLYPTLISLAGIEPVPNRNGRDLRAALEEERPLEPRALIGFMDVVRSDTRAGKRLGRRSQVSGGHFYRDPTWHYVHYLARPSELYRIVDDPDERNDLARQNPQLVARFDVEIGDWDRRMRADVEPDPYVDAGDAR